MRVLLKISYDGSHFHGFQRLKDYDTVQKRVEDALSIICKKEVVVKGAGRTDIGVHAHGQCLHFDFNESIPFENLQRCLNRFLAPYIFVKEVIKVNDDFHARFSVKEKTYVYKIYWGEYDPTLYSYSYYLVEKPSIFFMEEASKLFLGVHDFRNFVSGERDNFIAGIQSITFQESENSLEIVFKGKSFYRYMVRNLVGAMLDVSQGKATLEDIQKMLQNPLEKRQLSCAPARGLYLEEICYF